MTKPRTVNDPVDLWSYDPEQPGWNLMDTGPRHEMAAEAMGAANRAARNEDYRRAWVLTDKDVPPPALIDRDDPDVFHPFPEDQPSTIKPSGWTPLTGIKSPVPAGPVLPPEPPVGTVLAWVTEQGYPQTAIRTGAQWAISGREEDSTWAELVDEFDRDHIDWEQIGLVTEWVRMNFVYPWPVP